MTVSLISGLWIFALMLLLSWKGSERDQHWCDSWNEEGATISVWELHSLRTYNSNLEPSNCSFRERKRRTRTDWNWLCLLLFDSKFTFEKYNETNERQKRRWWYKLLNYRILSFTERLRKSVVSEKCLLWQKDVIRYVLFFVFFCFRFPLCNLIEIAFAVHLFVIPYSSVGLLHCFLPPKTFSCHNISYSNLPITTLQVPNTLSCHDFQKRSLPYNIHVKQMMQTCVNC